MVITSKAPLSAVALLALSVVACAPEGDAGDFTDQAQDTLTTSVDPRIAAAQSSLALASDALDDEDPADGLAELLIAADLVDELSPTDAGFCELGFQTSQIADEMLEQGAYSEARMGYAVAIHFAQGCESVLPEERRVDALRLRQHDARAVHQWALASTPSSGAG
jgi:hypothetical protein